MRLQLMWPKLVSALIIVGALAGFWYLSNGMSVGPASITGYADERTHQIGALQTGRLKALRVTLGQSVRAGDVLAELDPRPFELERERLRAQLKQAEAQLSAQVDIERANLQRTQLQAVRMHVGEERTRAELRELNKQVERLQSLRSEQLVRASDLEAARQRQRAMAADLATRPTGTTRSLALMGLRPRPAAEQDTRLQERLAPYRAAVAVADAAVREIEHTLGELLLRAPVDGQVSAILQQPGDVLRAGMPVVMLSAPRPGYIVGYVPERQSRRIALGLRVRMRRIGVLSGGLTGQIVEVSPALEPAPARMSGKLSLPSYVRRIVVRVDDNAPLLPGETFHIALR